MEELKRALELYEKGVKAYQIKAETGLSFEQFKEFVTPENEKNREIALELQRGNFAEEWDKARFKLLGKKK